MSGQRFLIGICFCILATVFGGANPSAQEAEQHLALFDPPPPRLTAEKKATIQLKLEALKNEVANKKLTFSIGWNNAMQFPIHRIAGARIPADLAERAAAQHNLAEKLLAFDNAAKPAAPAGTVCIATLAAWDYRTVGKVTPVRDQGNCGSCWDFAAVGALEASELIVNARPIDLSEQEVLVSGGAGDCCGGWHDDVFRYAVKHGVQRAIVEPYTALAGACNGDKAIASQAVAWDYVAHEVLPGFETTRVATTAEMKQALCDHGPVAACVLVTDLFQAYQDGVFKEDVGQDVLFPVNPTTNKKYASSNHVILIIGWDDSKHAWLIKNSWGNTWGDMCGFGNERGYMWIDYDSNNIGYYAAWVQAKNLKTQLPAAFFQLTKMMPSRTLPKPGPFLPRDVITQKELEAH